MTIDYSTDRFPVTAAMCQIMITTKENCDKCTLPCRHMLHTCSIKHITLYQYSLKHVHQLQSPLLTIHTRIMEQRAH